MDRGAWWATVHGVAEVLDTTENLNYYDWAPACIPWLLILCSSLFQQFPPNTSNSALYFYSFFSSSFNPSSSSLHTCTHPSKPSHTCPVLSDVLSTSPLYLGRDCCSLPCPVTCSDSPSQTTVIVHSLSRGQLFAAPWTAAPQAFPASTVSWSSLRLMSMESVMPSWNF